MTEPISPHELSGLLDGELSPQRAAELRRLIDENPGLRAEFDQLARLDADWSAAASQAMFQPVVVLGRRCNRESAMFAGLALGLCLLLGARLLPKLSSAFMLSATVHAIMLIHAMVALIFLQGLADSPPDRCDLVREN